MDSDNDSYFEESSSEDEQEVAGPLHIEINLEEPPEAPEAGPPSPLPPPPILQQELAPGWELPDDGNNFLNFYTRTDVMELKNWAQETRNRVNEVGYVVEAPVISQNFEAYLLEHQWKAKFLQHAAEPLFERMLAYIAGYARLTSFNKHQLRNFYETWADEERAVNLRMLAESGGFLEIEYVARLCRSSGAF